MSELSTSSNVGDDDQQQLQITAEEKAAALPEGERSRYAQEEERLQLAAATLAKADAMKA